MNQSTLSIAAIVAAAVLTGILVTAPTLVYADDTETSTEQSVKQKNTGSGDSANFNCGENLIKAGVGENDCEFGNGGGGGMNGGGGNGGGGNGGGEEEGNFCHNPEGGPAITQNLPPPALEMHLGQIGTPGHEGDHLGPCLPGET